MSDKDIIKSLECCTKAKTVADCDDLKCPARRDNNDCYYLTTDNDCDCSIPKQLIKDALSAIKRQHKDLEEKK